ncbi:MAG: zinc metalloprotease HtpX [candidate division Zixibacteria bacterium]|nr:zinc metalloprotease HtpX [candidate division Zixibacteria bacterium]
MNGVKVAVLMGLLMALFMGLGYMFGGQNGMIIAFFMAAVMNFVTYWYSDKLILKMYRARPVEEKDHPELYRIVKRVSTQAMIPMPKVYIIPTRGPNAFATGRDIHHAAVAATEGLLELLTEDEIEGVMGHEIAHILNRDMLVGTVAATFAGAIGMIASMLQWSAIFGGGRSAENRGGGLGMIVAIIVAPIAAMLLQVAISRQREYQADAEGGRLTGKYLSLASALDKLHRAPVKMNLDDKPATAHLMIANPLSGKGMAAIFSTHPPVEKRIEKLRELAMQAPYKGYA